MLLVAFYQFLTNATRVGGIGCPNVNERIKITRTNTCLQSIDGSNRVLWIPHPHHTIRGQKGMMRSVRPSVCLSVPFFTARRYAKRGICRRRVSVCLCVCMSVTLRYCIKTAKRRITQTTPHDSPLTLVFWHQSSLRNSNGITPYGGDKCRWGELKFVTFDEKRALTRKRYKIDI